MDPERKSVGRIELKTDGDGAFVATFATLNVVDHHGDVTVPGAYEDGKSVLIGAYQHEMYQLPVGKGVIRADDERAWVEGSFFTDTQPGIDTYKTVKNAGELMEWSYIFTVQKASFGEFEAAAGPVEVRYLEKLDVWSVDPVLRGAGIGTRTDSIKSFKTFADEAESALAAAESLVKRSRSLADLRAKEGRTFSAANVERLAGIAESLKSAAAQLDELLTSSAPKGQDLQKAFMEYQRSLAVLQGAL